MAFPHQLCQCVTHTLECATLVLQKCLFLVGAVSYPYFWSNASILGSGIFLLFPKCRTDIATDSFCFFLHIYLALLCFSLVMIICVTYSWCVFNKLF